MDPDMGRRTARSPATWAALVVPPLAWGFQLFVGDMLFELGCAPGVRGHVVFGLGLRPWSGIITGAAAGATLVAGAFAVRAWRRARSWGDVRWAERARTMLWWGLVSVGFYLLIILYGAFPPLFVNECAPLL
jgi:hypothetical protein